MDGARHRGMVQELNIMAWSRTSCPHSGMATPTSLLISSRLVRRMCTASLMSKVVLFFAWSNMLVSSHSIGCCCPRACSAISMADFSVSSHLVASSCSFIWVSKAFFVSLIYTWSQLQGIWYITPDIFSSLGPWLFSAWSLTLFSCPWLFSAVCWEWMPIRMVLVVVSSAYPSQIFNTMLMVSHVLTPKDVMLLWPTHPPCAEADHRVDGGQDVKTS